MFIRKVHVLELIALLEEEKSKIIPSGLPWEYAWLVREANPQARENLFDEYIRRLRSLNEDLIPWEKTKEISEWLWANKENNENGLMEWRRKCCDYWSFMVSKREAAP